MKYYILVGEASGDLHGANLIKGILANDADAEFRFWGGDMMRDAASGRGELVKHYNENSLMGFMEVLGSLGKIARLLKFCKQDIVDYAPDVVIFIDYPGFNLKIAKFVKKKLGIPSYYYIAPKVWAWKEWRVKTLRKVVDELFVIFPFEVDYFKRHGISTHYEGNPLVDSIESRAVDLGSYVEFTHHNGLDPSRSTIALVPGSRSHEISYNLPVMLDAVSEFPDYQVVVTGVDWLPAELYAKYINGRDNVKVIYNQTYRAMAHASGALVTSGTATLEAGLLSTPQVVCFRASFITIWLVARLIKVKYVSLVNLVMQREVVKEMLQQNFKAHDTALELKKVMPEGEQYSRLQEDYKSLKLVVGEAGASQRVAKCMVELLRSRKK